MLATNQYFQVILCFKKQASECPQVTETSHKYMIIKFSLLNHMSMWVTERNCTVMIMKGGSKLCSKSCSLWRSWNCNLSNQKTLLLWGNLFEMQTRFLYGACAALLLLIMMSLPCDRPLQGVGSVCASPKAFEELHQLRNRKFSEHFVLSQVHKLRVAFGTGSYAYENQTWHYSLQLDYSHLKISTNCPWMIFSHCSNASLPFFFVCDTHAIFPLLLGEEGR